MSENVKEGLARLHRRENWRDFFLLSLAVILLGLEVVYLLHQIKVIQLPLPWEVKANIWKDIGHVVEKRNVLKSRGEASLTWYPLGNNDVIHLRDSLLTGPDSTARLELQGKGEILLESNTLVRFGENNHATNNQLLNLELGQGVVRVRARKVAVPFKLRNHRLILSPDSELVLSKPPMAEQSQVQVKSGEVKVIPDTEEEAKNSPPSAVKKDALVVPLTLKVGEALQVQPQRGIARIETSLNIEPKYPVDHARIFAKNNLESISIYWSGEEAKEVELSREPEFLDSRKLRTSGRSVQAELVPGRYYWRVRRDVAMSAPREFTLMPPVQYNLISPADKSFVKEGSTVELRWDEVRGASHYVIEISRTEEFKEYLLQSDVTENLSKLPAIKAGIYFWRVRAAHPEWGQWQASPVHSFQAKKKLMVPKLKGAKVIPGQQSSGWGGWMDWLISSAYAGEENVWVEFEWEPTDGAHAYRLEIFGDAGRTELLESLDVEGTRAHVELPRRESFYWRLAAVDEGLMRSDYSKMQKIAVAPEKISVPTDEQIVSKEYFPRGEKKKDLVEKRRKSKVAPDGKVAVAAPSPEAGSSTPPPEREIASGTSYPRWIPTSIAAGIGGQGEIETVSGNQFDAQSVGGAQVYSLEVDHQVKDGGWRLRANYRRNYLGLEGGVRSVFERFGLESVVYSLFWGISMGVLGQEELALRRLTEEWSVPFRGRTAGIEVGKVWNKSMGNWLATIEMWAQGFFIGDFNGYGARGELSTAYAGMKGFIPEIDLQILPRSLFGDAGHQWTVEALASLRLRIDLNPSGSARR